MKALLLNLFTGDNDKDISFVRVLGAFGFIMVIFMITIGVPLWTLIAIKMGIKGMPTLAEWSTYYTGASVLIGSTFAGMASWLWVKERPDQSPPQ